MPATIKMLTDEQRELRELLGDALSSSFGDGFYDGFIKAKKLQEEYDKTQFGSLDDYEEDDILALSESAEELCQSGNVELRKFLDLEPVAAEKKHDLIEYVNRHDSYRKRYNQAINLMKTLADKGEFDDQTRKELVKFLGEEP